MMTDGDDYDFNKLKKKIVSEQKGGVLSNRQWSVLTKL